MTVILDSLKKTFDEVALFVQFRIKVMLNFEIGFVGNASNGSVLGTERANVLATVRFIRKNFFTAEFNFGK